jgi:hypothetical protein
MHCPILIVATLCLAFLVVPKGAAQHHHAGAAKSAQAELGASAVFDLKGVLWAAHNSAGHVAVSRSDDFGRSWASPVFVTPVPEATDMGGDARPKIALGSDGEIYVTWTRPMREPYTGEIRFSRSLDGGKSFVAPMTVHRDRQEITHRFDAIAVNPKGQIFVAWIDKRDLVATARGNAAPYRGAAVYFAISDDRGTTFRGDFKLADHCCECCRVALVARADGTVTAIWRHIFAPNIRDHAIATMHPDGTAGEVRRATFEDWRIDACPHHGPSIALGSSDRLHAVWFSGAPISRGVFFGRLREGGIDALRRVGSERAAHADVAVMGERVAIAWKTFEDDRSRLRGMVSSDGGNTWREFDLASSAGPSDHPRVLWHGGRFFVFWNTREEPLSVTPIP